MSRLFKAFIFAYTACVCMWFICTSYLIFTNLDGSACHLDPYCGLKNLYVFGLTLCFVGLPVLGYVSVKSPKTKNDFAEFFGFDAELPEQTQRKPAINATVDDCVKPTGQSVVWMVEWSPTKFPRETWQEFHDSLYGAEEAVDNLAKATPPMRGTITPLFRQTASPPVVEQRSERLLVKI